VLSPLVRHAVFRGLSSSPENMEADFGRFFLADYQCAAPSWAQQQKPAVPAPTPSESRPDAPEEGTPETTDSPSSFGQRRAPEKTATGRAEHGVENSQEIDAKGGQNSDASTQGTPPEPETVPEVVPQHPENPRGHSVSFDTDGYGPSVNRTPASPSSNASAAIASEKQVQEALDLLFADERLWQLISTEVSKSMRLRATLGQKQGLMLGKSLRFRVQVPKPYPGVQYRKSKDLEDKYPRYAKHGSTIVGEVEADNEWVKVRGMYLPMRLGTMQILELLPETPGGDANGRIHFTQEG